MLAITIVSPSRGMSTIWWRQRWNVCKVVKMVTVGHLGPAGESEPLSLDIHRRVHTGLGLGETRMDALCNRPTALIGMTFCCYSKCRPTIHDSNASNCIRIVKKDYICPGSSSRNWRFSHMSKIRFSQALKTDYSLQKTSIRFASFLLARKLESEVLGGSASLVKLFFKISFQGNRADKRIIKSSLSFQSYHLRRKVNYEVHIRSLLSLFSSAVSDSQDRRIRVGKGDYLHM